MSGSGEDAKVAIGDQQLPLQNLNTQQLQQLSQQLNVETEALNRNLKNLQDAAERFQSSSDCVKGLEDHCENGSGVDAGQSTTASGRDQRFRMLVPLSGSVYVDGFVSKTMANKVLVDVGTGYYLEKSSKKAQSFLDSKAQDITANCGKVQELIKRKQGMVEEVNQQLQYRAMADQMKTMSQEDQAGAAAVEGAVAA